MKLSQEIISSLHLTALNMDTDDSQTSAMHPKNKRKVRDGSSNAVLRYHNLNFLPQALMISSFPISYQTLQFPAKPQQGIPVISLPLVRRRLHHQGSTPTFALIHPDSPVIATSKDNSLM